MNRFSAPILAGALVGRIMILAAFLGGAGSLQAGGVFADVASGSAAWGDYNKDGFLDVLLMGDTSTNRVTRLYQNQGGTNFVEMATVLPGLSLGTAAWGDYDNDGLLDLLLTGTIDGTNTISRVYRNQGDDTFVEVAAAGLPGVSYSSAAWGDFDNDGRLDLLLTGTTNGSFSASLSRVYRNNGDGTFSDIGAGLPGILLGSVAWGDYDNDGRLDILLSGFDGINPITRIYRNNEDGTFTEVTAAGLPGVYAGSVAWGDYDNDGRLDVLLSGYTGKGFITRIYRNVGGGSFVNLNAGLPGLVNSAVAWGDYDNDGNLDLLLTGTTNGAPTGAISRIYRNVGGTAFVERTSGLPPVSLGAVAWGDYDNDGVLDVVLIGRSTDSVPFGAVYRNSSPVTNTPPAAPIGLSVSVTGGNRVNLRWQAASDGQTPAQGLTYNVALSTRSNVLNAPMADLTNGFRRVVQAGNAGRVTNWTFSNLPAAPVYYWKVQAIDGAFAGGAWSEVSVITPALTATRAGSEQISISWPSFWTGYALEQNAALPNPPGWSSVVSTPINDGTNRTVTLPLQSGPQFFRLIH